MGELTHAATQMHQENAARFQWRTEVYFKQFLHDESGCASYFIASRQSREAIVIDPQRDIRPYLELASDRGYVITSILDTHLHADHVSGNRVLAAATSGALYLHSAASVAFPFCKLEDGDELRIGQIVVRVLHTPGHRPEAISLLVTNLARSDAPSMVLSGDTLFVGDVGRPDFGGPEGAAEQYQSIQRLLDLEDWVEVFPAHFEGSCGKRMCGRPSSTIGFERRFNPVLQLSELAFKQQVSETAPRPLNMTAILEANRGLGHFCPSRDAESNVPGVALSDAPDWLREHGADVIDVREPLEFEEGHLPGAISIPQADLALRLVEISRERPILVVCAAGARSLRATAFLRSVGYLAATNLLGGTNGWRACGYPIVVGPS